MERDGGCANLGSPVRHNAVLERQVLLLTRREEPGSGIRLGAVLPPYTEVEATVHRLEACTEGGIAEVFAKEGRLVDCESVVTVRVG